MSKLLSVSLLSLMVLLAASLFLLIAVSRAAGQSQCSVITSQPANVTVCAGQSATFSVSTTPGPYNIAILSYEWQMNGVDIPSADPTSPTYTIPSVQPPDAGSYDVIVHSWMYGDGGTYGEGVFCVDISNPATLVVNIPSCSITWQPSNAVTQTSGDVTLRVVATGTVLGYQWWRWIPSNNNEILADGKDPYTGAIVSGSTTANLTLSGVTATDDGAYHVTVFGTAPCVVNSDPTLTVVPDLAAATKCSGNPPTITVSVSPTTIADDGQMHTIGANVTVGGDCAPWGVTLTSITANEPAGPNDIQNAVYGDDWRNFDVRGSNDGSTSRTYTVTYTVTDNENPPQTATASAQITVEPNPPPPPTIAVSLSPTVIPFDGQMHAITAQVTASGYAPVSVALTSVTANEPTNPGDIQNATIGADCRSFSLLGVNDGSTPRTYTVVYTVSDGVNPPQTATASADVNVVGMPPAITQQPLDQSVLIDASASFSSTATGSPTPTEQWQESTDAGATWSDIAGATLSTLTLSAVTMAQNGYRFRASFTNSCGTTYSDEAVLTVKILVADLGPVEVCVGAPFNSNNGNKMDLLVELFQNDNLILSGVALNQQVVGNAQNSLSKSYTVALPHLPSGTTFAGDDLLKCRVSVRRRGGTSDFPVNLWFNGSPTPKSNQGNKAWSRIQKVTIDGSTSNFYYLRSQMLLAPGAGSSASFVNQTAATTGYQSFGVWSILGSAMKRAGTASSQGETNDLVLTVHPNPATNFARICVEDLPEGIPAVVEVVNEAGESVATLYNATPEAELGLCLTLDCSKLPNGTYFAHLQNGTRARAAKLSVQH